TTAPNAAGSCATLMKWVAVRKDGFTKAPMTTRRTITGSRASSRIQLAIMCLPWRRSVPAVVCPCWSTGRSTADLLITIPLSHSDPSRVEVGSRPSTAAISSCRSQGGWRYSLTKSTFDHDQQARTDAQVLQVVGDQQHHRAAIACGV